MATAAALCFVARLPTTRVRCHTAVLAPVMMGTAATSALTLGPLLGSGTYGVVREAQWWSHGRLLDVVAKSARVSNPDDAAMAAEYLNVEALVHEALEAKRQEDAVAMQAFCRFLGRVVAEGDVWLLWERLPGCDVSSRPLTLAQINQETGPTAGRDTIDDATRHLSLASFGLSPRVVLRQTLRAAHELHDRGFVHRDIKTANLLLSDNSLYLIDLGSCAQMAGCNLLDGWLGKCAGYDASRSPCSPLFAPPERFVDPQHPFAFDVFSIGLVFLRLCWPSLLATDAQVAPAAVSDRALCLP